MDQGYDSFPDSFNAELADAVRKSWSESQNNPQQLSLTDSPVGTPTNHSNYTSSPASLISSNKSASVTSPQPVTNALVDDGANGYQLIERHYSLTENTTESISDILIDLNLGTPECEETVKDTQPIPIRRGSLQDVQRVRQLLNPRSSFSGVSSNEPEVPQQGNIAWVTILKDDKPESIKPVIVLDRSLKQVNSKYRLCVLHSEQTNSSELRNVGIETICFEKFLPELLNNTIHSNSIIILFIALVNRFDLVCYLAPTCMAIENIDELLDSEEICNEIDNETCVLLTNESPDSQNEEDSQIIILRPSSDVAMCIKEFFTVYGNDENGRKSKICCMRDSDVLKTLFNETWGHLSSEGYCTTLTSAFNSESSQSFYKIVDFKILKPWNVQKDADDIIDDTLAGQWHLLWLDFLKSQNNMRASRC